MCSTTRKTFWSLSSQVCWNSSSSTIWLHSLSLKKKTFQNLNRLFSQTKASKSAQEILFFLVLVFRQQFNFRNSIFFALNCSFNSLVLDTELLFQFCFLPSFGFETWSNFQYLYYIIIIRSLLTLLPNPLSQKFQSGISLLSFLSQ